MIALQLPKVPMPGRVIELVMDAIPEHICKAVWAANDAKREVLRYRPLASADDQADRETQLSILARENKTLAAYDPSLLMTPVVMDE